MIEVRSKHAIVAIAPDACGAVTRFAWERSGGVVEWLRPATEGAVESSFPQGMACFPLVPFSNRIRDGRFRFRGEEIALPPNFPPEPHAVHGHGWHASWDLVEHRDDAAVIEYLHEPDEWPFPYRARQTFRVTPEELVLQMSVKNQGEKPMPLGFGFHPYFIRTPRARLRTSARGMWESDGQSMPVRVVEPPDLGSLDPNAIELDNNFTGWSGQASIEWPEWQARLEMKTEGPFECFVIYTPKGKDFFCAEPATNCIDAFNLAAAGRDDTGMLVIGPGEETGGSVRLVPVVES
ncbi:MAG TPA: aldose 1-epimerase [Thermoanaerobaculia bacterium]|nr:aldose 1-epimerase [Thermoanaerobaculia bacterium]